MRDLAGALFAQLLALMLNAMELAWSQQVRVRGCACPRAREVRTPAVEPAAGAAAPMGLADLQRVRGGEQCCLNAHLWGMHADLAGSTLPTEEARF